MTNPGSLTMVFSGVDPRQLAPSVANTQVGITILAVPSSASRNSKARFRSNQPEEFKITANISAAPSRSLGLQLCQDQYYGGVQVRRHEEEIDDPKDRRKVFTKGSRS